MLTPVLIKHAFNTALALSLSSIILLATLFDIPKTNVLKILHIPKNIYFFGSGKSTVLFVVWYFLMFFLVLSWQSLIVTSLVNMQSLSFMLDNKFIISFLDLATVNTHTAFSTSFYGYRDTDRDSVRLEFVCCYPACTKELSGITSVLFRHSYYLNSKFIRIGLQISKPIQWK